VEVMDGEGRVVLCEELWSLTPAALAPGETGYIVPFLMHMDEVDFSALTDYAIHLYAEEATYYEPPVYLPSEGISAQLLTETDEWGDAVSTLYVTFTNTSDQTIFDFHFAMGVYDEGDALIYTCESSTYNVGVPAGQTVIISSEIDDMITSYWAENGIVPASVKVMGYQN